MSRVALALSLLVVPALAACGDGAKKRPIGATCDVSSQCESGICGGGQCLDPEADEDGDNLVNRVEAALGTDPVRADSDGDGVADDVELGSITAPVDSDGDGKIDAIESAVADGDGDCLPEQEDPEDDFSNAPSDAFPDACGDGQPVIPCASVSSSVGKSCVAPLVTSLRCFDPAGCFSVDGDDATTLATWGNGAKIVDRDDGRVTYVGSSGADCFAVGTDSVDPSVQVTYYVGSAAFEISQAGDSQPLVIRCPSGARVTLEPQDIAAITVCTGGNSGTWEPCAEQPTPR